MKFILAIVVLIHGLIHLAGYRANHTTLPAASRKQASGTYWLAATLLWIAAAAAIFLVPSYWWIVGGVALLISQTLIIGSWKDARYGTIINAVMVIFLIVSFSTWNFRQAYVHDVKAQMSGSLPATVPVLAEADIVHLPIPVQSYLRYTGSVGKPRVFNFKVEFDGQLRQNEASEWMQFTSEQHNTVGTANRMFFMNATMKHLPVAGYHRYGGGEAFMDIRLLSLFQVEHQSGPQMSMAETVTFFNDMCAMAPATLVDKRVRWLTTDGNRVKASFTANGTTITAWLHFNDSGQLVNFVSDDRFALQEDGSMQRLRWSTPMKDYRDINGYRLATYAEATYQYPDHELCYGIFKTTNIQYNLTKNDY